jgi:hypothetical protein
LLDGTKTRPKISAATNKVKLCTLPAIQGIVRRPIVVKVEISLDPLKHLKIVLILRFHQLSGLYGII